MVIKQYVVDAFTDKVFKGNPAAVCVLEKEISDKKMQSIAKENNLSETAFLLKTGEEYSLRWFTPGGEIDLCGHATLASAFVIMSFIEDKLSTVAFNTKSGRLVVYRKNDLYEMDMPAYDMKPVEVTEEMTQAIGFKPVKAYMGRDLVCVMEDEGQVTNAAPDMDKVKALDGLLLHITAKSEEYDCITRSFAPKLNVQEDPVCGSGHCHVAPFWINILNKDNIVAYQASDRSGVLYCHMVDNRVIMAGKAALFSKGEIYIPDEI